MPASDRTTVKSEVANFVKDSILDKLSSGQSPVKGESFKRLSKEYAQTMKGGDRTPNMELEGDMLDALTSKNTKDGVEVGFFKKSQALKADGHGHYGVFGQSQLPRRRILPDEEQSFKREIEDGISDIVSEFEKEEPKEESGLTKRIRAEIPEVRVRTKPIDAKTTSLDITDLLSDQRINRLLDDILGN